ncbi:nucleotide pyrophosphohydrolase [Candidatus Woesearchaeota archaeon]|nr:nucleotide pyrophosphohydrolase [Candidatus Woesearchaeota archaeon]|tara:strand:+ start:8890 stop:9270 length:381 start_codon:yes stop_codon:yes gene_type:complete
MKQSFEELVKVNRILLGEKGCAWDRKQTFDTIKKTMLSEAQEVKEAIEKKDYENLKEELGDLLYNVIFLSRMAEKKNLFSIKDVLVASKEKIVGRHAHVFGDQKLDDLKKISEQWHRIKEEEKKDK